MYQSDYILRMIEMLGVMWRRLLAALRAVRPEEALRLAEEAVGVVAETPVELVDGLDAESLVALLSAGGRLDVEKAALLAAVLQLRGKAFDLLGRTEEADAQWAKAAALETAVREVDPDRFEELAGLLGAIEHSGS